MKKYDVIVVGSGCGMSIIEEAAAHGRRQAPVGALRDRHGLGRYGLPEPGVCLRQPLRRVAAGGGG